MSERVSDERLAELIAGHGIYVYPDAKRRAQHKDTETCLRDLAAARTAEDYLRNKVLPELSACLSRIDYLCGPPNDMQVSGYDVHCDGRVVVEAVERQRASLAEALGLLRESRSEGWHADDAGWERVDALLRKANGGPSWGGPVAERGLV